METMNTKDLTEIVNNQNEIIKMMINDLRNSSWFTAASLNKIDTHLALIDSIQKTNIEPPFTLEDVTAYARYFNVEKMPLPPKQWYKYRINIVPIRKKQ